MTEAPRERPRLLYISAVEPASGADVLSLDSRITVGVLSRDFDISLAVAGPVQTAALNQLRIDLGPVRVTGGFDRSGADRPEPGLRRLMREVWDTDSVCARLQATLQRSAAQYDFVLIDSLLAWPYRPAGLKAPVGYVLRQWYSDPEHESGFLTGWRNKGLRDYERAAMTSADHVFAQTDIASRLSEWGVSMRSLKAALSQPDSARPILTDVDFNLTARRLGYRGYLGDSRNLASLYWFLDNVWALAGSTLPDTEFHIVGTAPPRELREKLVRYDNIKLHWSSDDAQLLSLHCRVMVEPLLFEDHVDAKLVNAMARGIPTVTTQRAIERSHCRLHSGLVAAARREDMVVAIKRLLSDSVVWNNAARESTALARQQLPVFELAHAVRRAFGGRQRRSGNA